MANAAIPLDPEPYDAAIPRPMGRNAAGEGFLRGLLRYADVDRFHLWNTHNRPLADLQPLIDRLGPPVRPVAWIAADDRAALGEAGAVHFPSPLLQQEAWARRAVGATAYSITGVTHTIAETHVLAELAGYLIAPLEEWDALVCTSEAVRRAVETHLEAVAHHLQDRLGATRIPPAQLVTIPLATHTGDFTFDPAARKAWRDAMDIPPDALVALSVGRFSLTDKMHPGPMGLALQVAARRLGRPIHWLMFGGARSAAGDQAYRDAAAALCPDVQMRFAGEAAPDAHGPVWSAADVFLSLSDNIQESFGLTVIEAMAAGLPGVVSDWNGYRDTLRHGVDGMRIRTLAPRPGLGADLAYAYAHGFMDYHAYAGTTAQFTAVDVEAAAESLMALFDDPDLRHRMGAAAQARARSDFDWRGVIGQYQALWAELARRRAAASPRRAAGLGVANPWAPDPFALFAAHPTRALEPADRVALTHPVGPEELAARLGAASVRYGDARLPTLGETHALVAALALSGASQPVVELLATFPEDRRLTLERGLLWLAKYGLVRVSEN